MGNEKYEQLRERITGNTFKDLEKIALNTIEVFATRKKSEFQKYCQLREQEGIGNEWEFIMGYIGRTSKAIGKGYITKRQRDKIKFYIDMMETTHKLGMSLNWFKDIKMTNEK